MIDISDVGTMITGGLKDCQHTKMELFFNDTPQTLARYPNINNDNGLWKFTNIASKINDTSFSILTKQFINSSQPTFYNQEIDPWFVVFMHSLFLCALFFLGVFFLRIFAIAAHFFVAQQKNKTQKHTMQKLKKGCMDIGHMIGGIHMYQ